MRVEPKTYFANERTFLSWLNMSVLMSSVAVGLIGLGGGDNSSKYGGVALLAVCSRRSILSGSGGLCVFSLHHYLISGNIQHVVSSEQVGLFFATYAIGMFHWRANKIRARDGRPYDDRFGPTVLVTALVCALIFNFVYTWTSTHIEPR